MSEASTQIHSQNHRITSWLRLEGTSQGHLVQALAQREPHRAHCQGGLLSLNSLRLKQRNKCRHVLM